MAESDTADKALSRGKALFGDLIDHHLIRELADADEEFARLFQQFVLGGMYDRNVLDQKTRELCAVGALTVQNAPHQLAAHMQAAKRMGATNQEILEVIFQMSVYCGMPYMLQAVRLFKKMVAEGKL